MPGCAGRPAGPVSLRPPAAAPARQSAMNNIPASLVLPGMRTHPQNRLPSTPTGRQDRPTNTPARRRWRPRRRRDRGNARPGPGTAAVRGQTAAVQIMAGEIKPGEITLGEPAAVQTAAVQTASGETVAAAMQLAIGLLTASLDSPALESWAVEALTPHDADGMATSWPACTWSPSCCCTSCVRRRESRRKPPCKGLRSWRSAGGGPSRPARARAATEQEQPPTAARRPCNWSSAAVMNGC